MMEDKKEIAMSEQEELSCPFNGFKPCTRECALFCMENAGAAGDVYNCYCSFNFVAEALNRIWRSM